MIYITTNRFKHKGNDGDFDIPYETAVKSNNDYLQQNEKHIGLKKSAVMQEYFARNDDDLKQQWSRIAYSIINAMLMRNSETKEDQQKHWDVLWANPVCNKYQKDYSKTTFL